MTIKTKFGAVAAAVLLSLGAAGSASAFTITAGEYKFNLDNYDSGTTGYGLGAPVCATTAACDAAAGITPAPGALGGSADTMGVFSIQSITNITTAATVFTKGVDGYITGIFGGLTDHHVDSGCIGTSCLTATRSVGGTWAMYLNAADYDPTLGPTGAGVDLNTLTYPGISDTGVLYLSGIFGVGVRASAGDATTTYVSAFDTATIAGSGQGYLEVLAGSAKPTFDTDAELDLAGGLHDMFLNVTFEGIDPTTNSGWNVISAGQISANAIPEPGALALVGIALLGAGAASRRRKA